MRKPRHLPLVAILGLLLSGFCSVGAQQQAGKTRSITDHSPPRARCSLAPRCSHRLVFNVHVNGTLWFLLLLYSYWADLRAWTFPSMLLACRPAPGCSAWLGCGMWGFAPAWPQVGFLQGRAVLASSLHVYERGKRRGDARGALPPTRREQTGF